MYNAVNERLVRNYDVYSVLDQAQGLPVAPRPDVMLSTQSPEAHPNMGKMLLIGAVVAVLLYFAFRKKKGGRKSE